MKKNILIAIAMILTIVSVSNTTLSAQNDAITSYFQKYMDNDAFSTVYISPKMFKLIGTITDENTENEIAELSKDIKTLRILSSNQSGRSLYKEAYHTLNTKSYEELMTVKDKGQDIRFMTKSKGDVIEELLLLMGSDSSFTMLSFTGNIDLDKLSKIADKLNIDGSEHLGKLNKR